MTQSIIEVGICPVTAIVGYSLAMATVYELLSLSLSLSLPLCLLLFL